jgi:uncharacterized protein
MKAMASSGVMVMKVGLSRVIRRL